MKSLKKARAEERAVRVAFRWRKASIPNHILPMLYLQDYFALIGTWSDHPGKQCNHKTYDSVLANQLETLVFGMLYLKGVRGAGSWCIARP
jgi:hypothetical protein